LFPRRIPHHPLASVCVFAGDALFLSFIAFHQQDSVAQVNIPGGRANLLPGIKLRKRGSYLMAEELNKRERFEQAMLPHMDAAYNLARWLTHNDHDAQDAVQEAYLRAYRFFESFRGGDSRTWLLAIVRNTCFTWMQRNRPSEQADVFDEQVHSEERESATPESLLLAEADQALVRKALDELPAAFREVLVLRELEGLSYKEIADVVGIPMGTVMSSLARARKRLREALIKCLAKEP
jgi:RNA polymerase sigma-70 factor (ECF subfamily)